MRSAAVTISLIAVAVASSSLTAQQRDCRPTGRPEQLPSSSALVDSARAVADLAAFSRSARTMLFSLTFNEDDSLPLIRPLDKADAIAAVVLMRALRPQPPSEMWAVRVKVAEGRDHSLTIERSIYCPPMLADSSRAALNLTTFDLRELDRVSSAGQRLARAEALVSVDGVALVVRMTGSTGSRPVDDEVVRVIQAHHFLPALLDGQPVQAVYRTGGKSPRL